MGHQHLVGKTSVYDMSYYLCFLKKPFLKFLIYKMDTRHSLVKHWENDIVH